MAPGDHEATLQAAIKSVVNPDGPPSLQASLRRTWTAPTPPIEYLERIDRLVPGCAERLIALAERQAAHRQSLEVAASKRETVDTEQLWNVAKQGQRNSMLMAYAGLAAAVAVAIWAAPPTSWVVASAIVAGVFGYFAYVQVQAGRALAPDEDAAVEGSTTTAPPVPSPKK